MSAVEGLQPCVVSMDACEVVPKDATPLGMTLARTVTHARHGSTLMVGVSWMEPGEKSNLWSTEDSEPAKSDTAHQVGPVHEIFFLVRGRLRVHWSGGSLDMGENDTLFLPPGHRYWVENPGRETAFLVYAETPPLG